MSKIDYFDLAAVKRQFETLTTHQERILFCQEVIDYLETDPDATYDHSIWDNSSDYARQNLTSKQLKADEALEFAYSMKERSERAVKRELLTESENVEATVASGPAWSNEAAAIALYALLRMAGYGEDHKDHNKTEVGNFARLLTERSPNTMKRIYLSAATRAVSLEAVELVAAQFEKMGLLELAADWLLTFFASDYGYESSEHRGDSQGRKQCKVSVNIEWEINLPLEDADDKNHPYGCPGQTHPRGVLCFRYLARDEAGSGADSCKV